MTRRYHVSYQFQTGNKMKSGFGDITLTINNGIFDVEEIRRHITATLEPEPEIGKGVSVVIMAIHQLKKHEIAGTK